MNYFKNSIASLSGMYARAAHNAVGVVGPPPHFACISKYRDEIIELAPESSHSSRSPRIIRLFVTVSLSLRKRRSTSEYFSLQHQFRLVFFYFNRLYSYLQPPSPPRQKKIKASVSLISCPDQNLHKNLHFLEKYFNKLSICAQIKTAMSKSVFISMGVRERKSTMRLRHKGNLSLG